MDRYLAWPLQMELSLSSGELIREIYTGDGIVSLYQLPTCLRASQTTFSSYVMFECWTGSSGRSRSKYIRSFVVHNSLGSVMQFGVTGLQVEFRIQPKPPRRPPRRWAAALQCSKRANAVTTNATLASGRLPLGAMDKLGGAVQDIPSPMHLHQPIQASGRSTSICSPAFDGVIPTLLRIVHEINLTPHLSAVDPMQGHKPRICGCCCP